MDFTSMLTDSMGPLFYFCLKKTESADSAEELSQDIIVSALASMKSSPPREFYPWLWRIARNRYSRWADEKHRRSELVLPVDLTDTLGEGLEPYSDDSPEATVIRSDELARLRRELAFVSRDYRELVVGYYIEDLSTKELARRFSLHPEAVKSRLFRARKLLKEGMDMAREFGKRSYKPEQVSFINTGCYGDHGQPWTIITHSMYKNIFLEVYGNPETAEQLAVELGIALPYMEEELEFLTRETLLKKVGDRYETTFPILSREVQRKIHEHSLEYAERLCDILCPLIDRVYGENPALFGGEIAYEDAKWALLMLSYNQSLWRSKIELGEQRTIRPDNGKWDLIGLQTVDFDEPSFVGEHGIIDKYDRNRVNFSQFKFNYKNIASKTPAHLTYEEGEALCEIEKSGKCDEYFAEKLCEYGYVRRDGDKLKLTVCVVKPNDAAEFKEAARILEEANKHYSELIVAELPELIKADEIQRKHACSTTVERGYIAEEALRRGWLVYDESLIKSIGAILMLD